MNILPITDAAFQNYGRVVTNVDFTGLVEAMKQTPLPENVVYEPSVKELEVLPVMEELTKKTYGEMPIQIGYCNGHNVLLNAVEYHRSSEINVAATDAILLLGCQQDIEADFTYDTANIEAFYVPAGVAVELYATTLHYAPCTCDWEDGFRCVVVLPKDTNTELTFDLIDGESKLMTAKNKWLIAHEDAKIEGAFCGLKGENITL